MSSLAIDLEVPLVQGSAIVNSFLIHVPEVALFQEIPHCSKIILGYITILIMLAY